MFSRSPLPSWKCDPISVLHMQKTLLLLLCLTGQVNTILGLTQQLQAVERSDSTSKPVLHWGLNPVLEGMLLFVFKAG